MQTNYKTVSLTWYKYPETKEFLDTFNKRNILVAVTTITPRGKIPQCLLVHYKNGQFHPASWDQLAIDFSDRVYAWTNVSPPEFTSEYDTCTPAEDDC